MTKRGEVLIFFKDWSAKRLASLPFLYHLMAEVWKKRVPAWKPGNWERAIDESHRAPDLRQAHPILQTTLWQRTRYPQQTTVSCLRFSAKKQELKRRGSAAAPITTMWLWFILAFDFEVSWIPISGSTRIPLTNKVWRPTLKNNYPARWCSNLLTNVSPMFTLRFEKKQLVEISWNTAP